MSEFLDSDTLEGMCPGDLATTLNTLRRLAKEPELASEHPELKTLIATIYKTSRKLRRRDNRKSLRAEDRSIVEATGRCQNEPLIATASRPRVHFCGSRKIAEVGLGCCGLQDESISEVLETDHWTRVLFGRIPSAKVLSLRDNRVSRTAAKRIATWIVNSTKLEEIDLASCSLDRVGTGMITKAAVHRRSLASVRLNGNSMSAEDEFLLRTIHQNRRRPAPPHVSQIRSVYR